MTDAVQLALIAASVPIITQIMLWLREAGSRKGIHAKLDHITVVTNSKLSEALARIDELESLLKESYYSRLDSKDNEPS